MNAPMRIAIVNAMLRFVANISRKKELQISNVELARPPLRRAP